MVLLKIFFGLCILITLCENVFSVVLMDNKVYIEYNKLPRWQKPYCRLASECEGLNEIIVDLETRKQSQVSTMLQILSKCEVKVHTVWKFRNLPATQILREISFGNFEASKNSYLNNFIYVEF